MMDRSKAANDLINAAAKWVEAHGGNALIGGGIGIMDADLTHNFYVTIKITGKRPEKSE